MLQFSLMKQKKNNPELDCLLVGSLINHNRSLVLFIRALLIPIQFHWKTFLQAFFTTVWYTRCNVIPKRPSALISNHMGSNSNQQILILKSFQITFCFYLWQFQILFLHIHSFFKNIKTSTDHSMKNCSIIENFDWAMNIELGTKKLHSNGMRNKVFHQFEWPPDVKEWNFDDVPANEFCVTYETHSFPHIGQQSQLLFPFRRHYSFLWLFFLFRAGVLDKLLFLPQRVNIRTIVAILRWIQKSQKKVKFLDECHWIQKFKNKKEYIAFILKMLEHMADCVHRFQTFHALAATKLMFLWVDIFLNFLSSFKSLDLIVCTYVDSNSFCLPIALNI